MTGNKQKEKRKKTRNRKKEDAKEQKMEAMEVGWKKATSDSIVVWLV